MPIEAYKSEPKMQKKRYFRTPKPGKLKFGDYGFLVLKEGQIEPIQISSLKKLLKKLIKKKFKVADYFKSREKIWFNVSFNFYLHLKSKNSRMGKGKGLVERKVIRIRKNSILAEFIGIPFWRLILVAKKINKKLSVKLKVISKGLKYYRVWSHPSACFIYYNKYLL